MAQSDSVTKDTSTPEEAILEVRNAEVTFDMDRGKSRVLDDVSMDIRREEILGVVGESGSGKSMFASALLDAVVEPGQLSGEILYHPTDGDSIDVTALSQSELRDLRWEEIAMVFQGAMSSFNPTMSIKNHFKETLKAHGYDLEEGLEHTKELFSELYLEPDRVLDSYPHELSGGMRQRALIALSLVLEPDVLVMDEPTAALDLLMQRSILSLLENLQRKYELTIIFITHDLPLVAGLADRLAVMYAFDFVEIGEADEIIREATHPYTRALLKSVPNLDTQLSRMTPIEGESPDPVSTPNGCSYHPRCPLADEQCRSTDPHYHEVSDNHEVACFHWEQAIDEVPLKLEESDELQADDFVGSQSEDPLLSLESVNVHFEQNDSFLGLFDDSDPVQAVDGIDLDIYENDVVALVGESGCGKTTLGKSAIGVERPTDGRVLYRGQDIWEARDGKDSSISYEEIRRSLQIIHQDPGSSLDANRTVKASLADPLKRWHPDMSASERNDLILRMLNHVGMTPAEDYAQRFPHQISGGEKQRVVLIRALLMNPDLILADEAVSALDVSLRVEMMDLMLEMQDIFDTSYLFISHNLSNARYLAGKADGRIGVMYLGRIVEMAPAEELIQNPQHPYTKVLMWSTATLETDQKTEDPPVRGIDIPDPVDPPSGCRFHTRCPEAREECRQNTPKLDEGGAGNHGTACFREYDSDHPYWDSDPLFEDD